MNLVYLGIVLFGGLHLFSSLLPAMRNRLQAWWGEAIYKGLYSAISLLGVGLMFWGYAQTRGNGDMLYVPPLGPNVAAMLMVLAGLILIVAANVKSNIKMYVAHPFSIGFSLIAVAHLLTNGKTAVIWIFATFLVVSLLDIAASTLRGNRAVFEPNVRSDGIAVAVGLAVFVVLLFGFHPYVLGVKLMR